MSDVNKNKEALFSCKAAASSWSTKGETLDVVECFLCFLALGMLTNLSFAFPFAFCWVGVYSSVTWSESHSLPACNNIPEKITHVWLAENKSIFHVMRVQSCNTNVRTWFLVQFLVKGHLKNFKDYKLYSLFVTGSWNIWSLIKLLDFLSFFVVVVVFFFFEIVSVLLCAVTFRLFHVIWG